MNIPGLLVCVSLLSGCDGKRGRVSEQGKSEGFGHNHRQSNARGRGIAFVMQQALAKRMKRFVYRPCPNCVLADEMAVDELRMGAGGLAVVLPF